MEKKRLDPLLVTPANIPAYPQNRVRLIVDDLVRLGAAPQDVQRVLMARGVNKWFVARRAIIHLKDSLKGQVTETIGYIVEAKRQKARPGKFGTSRRDCLNRLYFARGYLKATEEARARIRAICQMHRWQSPDPDSLQMLPSTGVRQLAKIHDLQGELQDAGRVLEESRMEKVLLDDAMLILQDDNESLRGVVLRLEDRIAKLRDC